MTSVVLKFSFLTIYVCARFCREVNFDLNEDVRSARQGEIVTSNQWEVQQRALTVYILPLRQKVGPMIV